MLGRQTALITQPPKSVYQMRHAPLQTRTRRGLHWWCLSVRTPPAWRGARQQSNSFRLWCPCHRVRPVQAICQRHCWPSARCPCAGACVTTRPPTALQQGAWLSVAVELPGPNARASVPCSVGAPPGAVSADWAAGNTAFSRCRPLLSPSRHPRQPRARSIPPPSPLQRQCAVRRTSIITTERRHAGRGEVKAARRAKGRTRQGAVARASSRLPNHRAIQLSAGFTMAATPVKLTHAWVSMSNRSPQLLQP